MLLGTGRGEKPKCVDIASVFVSTSAMAPLHAIISPTREAQRVFHAPCA